MVSSCLFICGGPRESANIRNMFAVILRDAGIDAHLAAFDSLILVAPSVVVDTLASSMPLDVRQKIVAHVDRDLSGARDQDLLRLLPLHLVSRLSFLDAAFDRP